MDAKVVTFRELLAPSSGEGSPSPHQIRVPIFQRAYEWGAEQITRLLEDALGDVEARTGGRPHFIGSIVLIEEPVSDGGPRTAMIIDGQQRLLTLAMAVARCERSVIGASVLENEGVRNPLDRPRVLAADVDAADFRRILAGQDPAEPRPLRDAVRTVDKVLEGLDPAVARARLLDGVQLVQVVLDRSEDAEAVFESLNTTGQPLTQADLVRTALLATFPTVDDQRQMDMDYWRPAETRLRDAVPGSRSRGRPSPKDRIVSDYLRALLMRDGGRVDGGRTYRVFAERFDRTQDASLRFLDTFQQLAEPYSRVHPEPAVRPGALTPHHVLGRLGYTVHHPLLLQLAERSFTTEEHFPAEELDRVMAGIESFVIRRAVVGWPTNLLSRLFENLCASRPVDRHAIWATMEPHWPSDDRFKAAVIANPLYVEASNVASIVLARLDTVVDAKDSSLDDEASLEHVMPQTIGASAHGRDWQEMLGPDWKSIHDRWLHTLANLTLTRRNAEMGNRRFSEKRTWLADSKFATSRRIGQLGRWDAAALEKRAARLASDSVALWPLPDGTVGHV